MAAKANPKLIGAFVVGGVALLVVAALTFGSFKFLEQRFPFVMYFEGDLTGLDPGAPIVYKGVRIGTVKEIQLLFDPKTRSAKVPVYAELEPGRISFVGGLPLVPGENIPAMIKQGLRAQLASQSILTGKLLVHFDFRPEHPARLIGADSGVMEIPTIPSEMEQLQASVEGVLDQVSSAHIPELIEEVRALVRGVNDAVERLDTAGLTSAGEDVLHQIQTTAADISTQVNAIGGEATRAARDLRPLIAATDTLIESLQRTSERAEQLLVTADGTIEPGSAMHRELVAMLREVASAARSMRILAEGLERQPSSVLFGKSATGSQ